MLSTLLVVALLVVAVPGFLHPGDVDLVTPWPLSRQSWSSLCGVLAALAFLAWRRESRESRGAPPRSLADRLLAPSLVLPFALVWTLGEPDLRSVVGWVWVAAALAPMAFVITLVRPVWGPRTWRGDGASALAVLLPVAALAGLVWRFGPGWGAIAPPGGEIAALIGYPLYALLQLLALLAAPAAVWAARGHSGPAVVAAVAFLFALAHWPQPLLAGAGGLFALGLATAYRRGASLAVLALAMGSMGASLAQRAPSEWTESMRTGPVAVERRILERRIGEFESRIDALAGVDHWDACGRDTARWIASVLGTMARSAPDSTVVEAWRRAIDDAHRAKTVRIFLDTEEYRRRTRTPGGWSFVERSAVWGNGFRPTLAAHALYDSLSSREHFEAVGGRWRPFLVSVRRALFEDEGHGGDPLAEWDTLLTAADRAALVEHLLVRSGAEDPRDLPRPEVVGFPPFGPASR